MKLIRLLCCYESSLPLRIVETVLQSELEQNPWFIMARCGPPDLLLPMAVSKRKREEQQGQNNSYFTESTLPTSMLFSALCSQITQHRLRTRSRHAACRLLYDILKKLTGTGKMKVAFTSEGRLYNIAIPRSGLVNSSVLGSFMDDAVSLSDVKRSWRKDAQDSCLKM